MTEEIMQQLGLSLSQSNVGGGFAKGVIKELEIAFNSCPSAPFFIDVTVMDAMRSWGIILNKDLIKHLAESFQDKESKAIIPHPEGGFFTIHKEPFIGSPVETFDEASDQLLCIDNDVSNWFVQEGSLYFDTVEESEGIWTLEFDGSHSNSRSGAGIVLKAPSGEVFYHSYRLEYHCTNNIAECEALILGLNLAIDKGVTHLREKGDSNLIVSQVMMRFSTKNEKLKKYRDMAQSLSKSFRIVSLEAIPQEENHVVDAFFVSSSTLQPCEGPLHDL
jgi:ribonuclease HI